MKLAFIGKIGTDVGYSLALIVLVYSVSSVSFGAAKRSKEPKKPTPTTKQLYGTSGTFKGGQTIASLPRLAGR